MKIEKLKFCHLKISNTSFEELIYYTGDCIKEKKHIFIVPLTLRLFIKSIFSKSLRNNINNIDILIPINMFLFFLIKLWEKNYRLKYSDVKDLISALIIRYNSNNTGYVFIGSSLNGLSFIVKNLKMSFKNINILGLYPEELFVHKRDDVNRVLKKIEPDIVFVDYKEEDVIGWVLSSKDYLKKSVIILCEKKLKIMAGEISDVPYKFKKRNLEYFYKFINNPLHVFDIIIFTLVFIYFLGYLLKKTFRRGKK